MYNFDEIIAFMKENNIYGKEIYNSNNVPGEMTTTIYNKDGVKINYSREYDYVVIFGLTDVEFVILEQAWNDAIVRETSKSFEEEEFRILYGN